MNRSATLILALVAATSLVAGGYWAGQRAAHGPMSGMTATASSEAQGTQSDRKVLYWHDPMVPGPRFDKPGKSPFMDMMLVPVYADDASDDTSVRVNPGIQQNLGIRTVAVQRTQVASSFQAIGNVQFDERLAVSVQTRSSGYVERLAVRAPMERVRKGQVLATVFSPEWLGPLVELAELKRAGVSPELLDAARERTRALSIPPELVRQAEDGAPVTARFTLTAPASGVIAELGVREGVAVAPGTTLFRIAGLEKVWAVAEVPEAQAVRLVQGQKVKAALQADPAQTFDGQLKELLPQVNASTRTLQARFEVDNRAGRLVPGMLLRLEVAGPTATRLTVPAEAVIRTGTRAVVIVRRDDNRFEPREVALGIDFGDTLEVTQGLQAGERIVASGQFLVDSEARLRSVLGSMAALPEATDGAPASKSAASKAAASYMAEGTVDDVDADGLLISHGPVPALKWPAMTMGFSVADPKNLRELKPGDAIQFEFRAGGPQGWEVLSIRKQGMRK
jgi:membrane fusion protein, copper/silver efflux system